MNLKDSYAKVENGEVFLVNAHISPYSHETFRIMSLVRNYCFTGPRLSA
jgi:tmRNA-binding protein